MPEIRQDIRSATFVVAANDSLHKNMADYVCDGVNDHLTIQAAIDAMTTGTVICLEGTYNNVSSVTLGDFKSIKFLPGSIIEYTGIASPTFILQGDHSGLEFDTLRGRADGTSEVAISLRGGPRQKITGGTIGEWTGQYFVKGVLFDQANSIDLMTAGTVNIRSIYGGEYGIDLEPGANTVEGNIFNINIIARQTVRCLRIGADGGADSVQFNHFSLGLEGNAETPQLFDCYCSRNTIDITKGFVTPTGAIWGHLHDTALYNNVRVDGDPVLIIDEGINLITAPLKNSGPMRTMYRDTRHYPFTDFTNWQSQVGGGGAVTKGSLEMLIQSGAAANGSAWCWTPFKAYGYWHGINYDAYQYLCVEIFIEGDIDTSKVWIKFDDDETPADPGSNALGFRIDNLAAMGITYDGVLHVVDLSTVLTSGGFHVLEMEFWPGQKVVWRIDGIYVGESADIPAGAALNTDLTIAVMNGATGGAKTVSALPATISRRE